MTESEGRGSVITGLTKRAYNEMMTGTVSVTTLR
jgi:hypothetical protein